MLVLGVRITGAFAMAWMGEGDVSEVSAGGWVTGLAIVALFLAMGWHLATRLKTEIESDEVQQKIADKAQEIVDEKDYE